MISSTLLTPWARHHRNHEVLRTKVENLFDPHFVIPRNTDNSRRIDYVTGITQSLYLNVILDAVAGQSGEPQPFDMR